MFTGEASRKASYVIMQEHLVYLFNSDMNNRNTFVLKDKEL